MPERVNPKTVPHEFSHRLRRWVFRCFRPAKFAELQKKRGPFDAYRCIFVHIPKCAGISMVRSLFGDFDCGHTGLRRYQIMFGPEEFNRYFKFTVVRNPFDRLVSAFHFLKKGGLNEKDQSWAQRHLAAYEDFDSFVRGWLTRGRIRTALHFRDQCSFLCVEDTRPAVDFIARLENLPEDFAVICQRLGIQATLQEANRNPSREKDYRGYYTPESRAIVEQVYADDLRVLGYTFDK